MYESRNSETRHPFQRSKDGFFKETTTNGQNMRGSRVHRLTYDGSDRIIASLRWACYKVSHRNKHANQEMRGERKGYMTWKTQRRCTLPQDSTVVRLYRHLFNHNADG